MNKSLLEIALDLRYWLEIQPPGALFHPSGMDVRETPAWQRLTALLDEIVAQGVDGGEGPAPVLFLAVPIRDVVSQDGSHAPTGALDVLQKMGMVLAAMGIEVCNQPAHGAVEARLFHLGSGFHGEIEQGFELVEKKLWIVHVASLADGLVGGTSILSTCETPPDVAAQGAV